MTAISIGKHIIYNYNDASELEEKTEEMRNAGFSLSSTTKNSDGTYTAVYIFNTNDTEE